MFLNVPNHYVLQKLYLNVFVRRLEYGYSNKVQIYSKREILDVGQKDVILLFSENLTEAIFLWYNHKSENNIS